MRCEPVSLFSARYRFVSQGNSSAFPGWFWRRDCGEKLSMKSVRVSQAPTSSITVHEAVETPAVATSDKGL